MFTSPRDFCVSTTVDQLSDGSYLIATHSVDHPDGQIRKKFVRASSMISGFIVTPGNLINQNPEENESENDTDDDESEVCTVTIIAHMDLGGIIPPAVTRFLGFSAPIKLVRKLRSLVEKK